MLMASEELFGLTPQTAKQFYQMSGIHSPINERNRDVATVGFQLMIGLHCKFLNLYFGGENRSQSMVRGGGLRCGYRLAMLVLALLLFW